MKDDTVKIVHKETGLEGQCLPESLPAWLSNGWSRVEEATPVVDAVPTPNLLRPFKPEHTTMVKLDQETEPDTDLED
jgi:hypothetical protein